MSRKTVIEVMRSTHVAARAGAFPIICADPPWPFRDKLPGDGRGAIKHYRLMSIEDICSFELPPIADNAMLFMWRVSAMVEEAYKVVRAWGFEPKSELIWAKTTVNGNRHFGMGHYTRLEHEACIIAVRGRPTVLRRDVRSIFTAPATRKHSEKPDEFFNIVEQLSVGPYCELFSRRSRPGWTCLGDEVDA